MPRTPVAPPPARRRHRGPIPEFPTVQASRPECLVLWRRRHGLTQHHAAERLGVPVDRIRRWEAGTAKHVPLSRVGKLRPHETCYVLRQREGLTQATLAVLMGTHRAWVIAMEAGEAPVERLVTFWSWRCEAAAKRRGVAG